MDPMVLPTWAIGAIAAGGGLIVVVLVISLVHIIKGRSKLFARNDSTSISRPEIFLVESCGAQFSADISSEGIKAKNTAGIKPFKPEGPVGATSNQYARFLDINHHTEASATEEQFEEVYEEIDAVKKIYSNENTKAKNDKAFKTSQDNKVFKEPENYYLQPLQ
ncbi:uncharacterized protein LOC131933023 [Physella acuta]|uniref:uncharacterized protein LOC131933023 n=1 Tax=Physella acuta TaxID=109671 RepID=UPI0027DD6495|nr:uncharacterized protein LOC131933023 [Physella acuta]